MSNIGHVFIFEFKVLLKRYLIFLIGALVVLIALAVDSVDKYQTFLVDSKKFQENELEKVKTYARYDQYGGYGIRLLSIPTPYGIISNGSFKTILANVNTGERLRISTPLKGKDFFNVNDYVDIGGIILLFGSLFGIFTGYRATKNKNYIKLVTSTGGTGKGFLMLILSRAVIINMLSLLLISLSLLVPLVKSINLFNEYFLYFALTVMALINFFFAIGVIVGTLKKRSTSLILALFFFLVLAVPWEIEKIRTDSASNIQSLFDFEKESLSVLMKAEKELISKFGTLSVGVEPTKELMDAIELVLNNEFKNLIRHEDRRKNDIYNKIIQYQRIAAFFPVSFFKTTVEEIAGSGGNNFIAFYNYCQKQKFEFLEFYIKKRFIEKASDVESFVKKDENVFFSKCQLPYGYSLGIMITLFYAFFLISAAYRLHKNRINTSGSNVPLYIESKSSFNFVLCENEKIKGELVNHYKQKAGTLVIEKITPDDFIFARMKSLDFLGHLCKVTGIEKQKAVDYLKILGSKVDNIPLSQELVLKIYTAVMFGGDYKKIVIDDLLKGESRKYERCFLNLLSKLTTSGVKVFYLSTQIFQTVGNLDSKINVDKWLVFNPDINQVSLR